MRIGLITDALRLDEKLIVEAGQKTGTELELIDSSSEFFDISSLEKGKFKNIDVFLQRCISTLKGLYVTKILEESGHKVVNDFSASQNCIDKLRCSILLAKNNIPTPKTMIAFTEEAGLEALKEIGYPAIIKPIIGSWARLVAKVNDEDAAKSVLEDRKEMGALNSIFYIQEFIEKPGRDIRAMVVGGKAIAAIYRINEGDWRTNTAKGARAEKCEITERIEELSIKAAEAMGNGIFGVDLMESENDFVVHEVNHSSEFKNIQKVTGVKAAEEILAFLKQEAKR